jgi:O-antigen/teichoic acid export membrane protein
MKKSSSMYEYFSTNTFGTGLREKAVRAAGATLYAQPLMLVFSTLGTIVLSRLLVPDDFGTVTMVTSFSLLLQNFGSSGFTEAIIQSDKLNHHQVSTLFWLQISSSLVLTILLILSAPLLAYFYKSPNIAAVTVMLSLTILASGFATIHLALMQRKLQSYKIMFSQMISTVVSLSIAIAMAVNNCHHWSVVTRRVLEIVVLALCAWIFCSWRPGLPRRKAGAISLYRTGVRVYANFIFNYLSRNLDKILLGKIFGPTEVGTYDRAYYLSSMLPNQLTHPLANVGIATLSRLQNDIGKFKTAFSKTISLMALVGMFCSAILFVIGNDLVVFLLGKEWVKTGDVFIAFAPSIGPIIIYYTHGWIHLSLAKPERLFKWSIFAAIVTLASYIIGLPFGAIGIASAYSISYYLLFIPALWYAGKPFQMKTRFFITPIWRSFIACLITVVLCKYMIVIPSTITGVLNNLNILIRMLILSLLSSIVYVVSIITLYGSCSPFLNLIDIAKEMLPKKSTIRI